MTTPIVIKDARHASTATMRLANLANLIEAKPSLLEELTEHAPEIVTGLRQYAAAIEGVMNLGI